MAESMPAQKLALSWADFLVALLVILAAASICQVSETATSARFARRLAEADAGPEEAIARCEEKLQRELAEVTAVRASRQQQELELAHDRATLSTIATLHPRGTLSEDVWLPQLPESARAAYQKARLDVDVRTRMAPALAEGLARREESASRLAAELREARRKRDAEAARMKEAMARERWMWSSGLALAGMLALLVLLALLLRRRPVRAGTVLHPRPILFVAAAAVLLMSAHHVFGVTGALVIALVGAGVILFRVAAPDRLTQGAGGR